MSSSFTITFFFFVRVKSIQNVIIKNEKKPQLEVLLDLKKYCFLIFVGLDLVVLKKIALECKILIPNPVESMITTINLV